MASFSDLLRDLERQGSGQAADAADPNYTEPNAKGVFFDNAATNYLVDKGIPKDRAGVLVAQFSDKGPPGFRTSRSHPGLLAAELDKIAGDEKILNPPKEVFRDPLEEVRSSIEALGVGRQGQLDLAREFDPQFAELSVGLQQRLLTGQDQPIPILQWYENEFGPAASNITADAARRQREADISDVETLGPRAAEAFRQANPELAETMTFLKDQAIGASPIALELERQALADLQLGSSLSPEERRQAQQASRAGFSARGLAEGPGSAIDEILQTHGLGEARQTQRRGFAGQVEGQRMARNQFAGNVANLQARTSSDPFQAILGRPSAATQFGLSQQAFGNQAAGNVPSQDPFSPFFGNVGSQNANSALDVFNTQVGINNQRNVAADEFDAAIRASRNAATGNIIGSVLDFGSNFIPA
ncbi:hypothetical protein N9937_01625 [bacterium]|nr:hypothetical protein [bacterium]